jgi:hypothetical protein
MPRINVRYDASVVRASELASLMPALADIGAEQYDTTPDKVVVELFAQSEFCLNHRTLDVEVSALPDPEGRREARIETFALALSDFLLDWMAKRNIAGAVGVETRLFASGAFAWAPVGQTSRVTHSSARQI